MNFTSNKFITCEEDIKTLEIPTMRKLEGMEDEDLFVCDACDSMKRLVNMYSHDWCKNCYKYWLRCKYTGKRYMPWKWKVERGLV